MLIAQLIRETSGMQGFREQLPEIVYQLPEPLLLSRWQPVEIGWWYGAAE
jgi:hypothetical protein